MSVQKKCFFYRSLNSINFGLGIGSCDLEGSHTICDGDVLYCEKPETLAAHLHRKDMKEKSGIRVELREPRMNPSNP
jgi:hypothetical protein